MRDAQTHIDVITRTISFADFVGFDVLGIDFSPIKGPEGNIEYLMNLVKKESISDEVLSYSEKEAIDAFEESKAMGKWLADSPEWKNRCSELTGRSHTELN